MAFYPAPISYTPGYNSGIPDFKFNPDPNDPELAERRRRLLESNMYDRSNITNELARSGLIGSSAEFGQYNEAQNRLGRGLEDAESDVYGRQRADALSLYKDNADFIRQLRLLKYRNDLQQHNLGIQSLGDIGGLLGGFLGGGFGGTLDLGNAGNAADYLTKYLP